MRYTDWFEVLDPRFKQLILVNVHVDELFTGGRWLEGPVYVPASRHLLFSDIPNNRVLRYNECDGSVSEFAKPSHFSNGHTLDRTGRVLSCEHQSRRVTRTEYDGSITVLAERFNGKRLNSPNDVIVDSRGVVWFTDPTYGIITEYEGARLEGELAARSVYRLDPSGTLTEVISDLEQPNGLALSRDEKTLYVVDSGAVPAKLIAYDLSAGRLPSHGKVVSECENGMYDGLRIDRDGNFWCSAGDGVHCLTPQGELIGKVLLPETVSNLCFGGPARNRMFITATRSLFAVYLNTTG